MPAVSIITPTYCHEKFISQCIESVLAQSEADWELIIVDDGSPDNTVQIASTYADPRIQIIRLKNRGIASLSETYNIALKASTSPVIAILEGDDFWPPDKLEIQLPDFEDPDLDLSTGFFIACKENRDLSSMHPQSLPPKEALVNEPKGSACLAMMDPRYLTFSFPVSTLIRKTALEAIGGFQQPEYLPLVDFPTFLNLGLQGKWKFHYRILGFWRRHGESVTKNKFPLILDGVYRVTQAFAAEHYKQLPHTPNCIEVLDRAWINRQIQRSIVMHRYLMDRKEYKRAASIAKNAYKYPVGPKSRWLLIIAYWLSLFRISTETLFVIARRGDWRMEFETATGDRPISPDSGPADFPYRPIVVK